MGRKLMNADQYRRMWNERADELEALAAIIYPDDEASRAELNKMVARARRHVRRPFWLIRLSGLLGHWSTLLALLVGWWIWALAADWLEAWWLQAFAAAYTLFMLGVIVRSYWLGRELAEQTRRWLEWHEPASGRCPNQPIPRRNE